MEIGIMAKKKTTPNFKNANYNQGAFIAISQEDQIQPGTFEHAIQHLIDNKLDLSIFNNRYNNACGGAPAYDPAVLLKIVLLAYSRGCTSSRVIEHSCKTNVTFMALSGFSEPHFTTIADFVTNLEIEIVDLFRQVLLICDQCGLIERKMFAIDGCKLPSNASKEWSGTHEELARKSKKMRDAVKTMVKKHKSHDNNATTEVIKQRELDQIETLEANADKIDAFLKENEKRIGRRGKEVKSNITDNESAKMKTSHGTIQGYVGVATVDEKHQVIMQADAHGEGQENGLLKESVDELKANINVIDNLPIDTPFALHGTKYLADSGYHSEDNLLNLAEEGADAYVADNKFRKRDPRFSDADRFKPSKKNNPNSKFKNSDFIFDKKKMSCICPAAKTLWLKNRKAGIGKAFFIVFQGYKSDCQNCEVKKACLRNPDKTEGRQVAFKIGNRNKDKTLTEKMIAKIDSEEGRHTYSKRLGIVEPVFGNIRENKGLRRFSLRGKRKVGMQWKLFCMIHNIEKIMNYGMVEEYG
jgi:transposase/23S rRNA maturation mini-RNase III